MVPAKMCLIWLPGAGAMIELIMAAGQIKGKVYKMLSQDHGHGSSIIQVFILFNDDLLS